MIFSDRMKLNEEYKKWIIKNNIKDTSFNMLSYLSSLNIFDENKVNLIIFQIDLLKNLESEE